MNNTISLSDLVYPVSTYNGNLDHSHSESEWLQSDILENHIPDNDIVDYDNIDSGFMTTYEVTISGRVKEGIKENDKILNAFKKYGIEFISTSFYTPKAYNFENDSIDIAYKINKDCKNELENEIQYYIDNIQQKSCDGYMSFEPDTIDKVELDDVCYFWAICKKADILDDLKDIIESVVEYSYNLYYELFFIEVHDYLKPLPEYKKWLKEKEYKEWQAENQLTLV